MLTVHEIYLPKPKLAVEGPGGVQASFDFRGAKNTSPDGCLPSPSLTTSTDTIRVAVWCAPDRSRTCKRRATAAAAALAPALGRVKFRSIGGGWSRWCRRTGLPEEEGTRATAVRVVVHVTR